MSVAVFRSGSCCEHSCSRLAPIPVETASPRPGAPRHAQPGPALVPRPPRPGALVRPAPWYARARAGSRPGTSTARTAQHLPVPTPAQPGRAWLGVSQLVLRQPIKARTFLVLTEKEVAVTERRGVSVLGMAGSAPRHRLFWAGRHVRGDTHEGSTWNVAGAGVAQWRSSMFHVERRIRRGSVIDACTVASLVVVVRDDAPRAVQAASTHCRSGVHP